MSVVGIVALGQALVIIAGGIDLSVGSVIGLSAVRGDALGRYGLAASRHLRRARARTLVGVVNGLLVTRVRINPFITTLGTLSIARGTALLVTNGNPQRFDNWAAWLGYGKIGELPVQFAAARRPHRDRLVLRQQAKWGRNVYAVGDNARAARLAGVDVRAHTDHGVHGLRRPRRARRPAARRHAHQRQSQSRSRLRARRDRSSDPRRRCPDGRTGLHPRRGDRRGADGAPAQRLCSAQCIRLLADHHDRTRGHHRGRRRQSRPAED